MAEVFVSGQVTDLDNVRATQDALRQAGHTITHDWTYNEGGSKMLDSQQAKFDNPDEAANRAYADMHGVVTSDVYVICTDNEKSGKGMYAELGGALALNEKLGSPLIYMLGKMAHSSIFYFHPAVRRRADVQQIIEEIKDI